MTSFYYCIPTSPTPRNILNTSNSQNFVVNPVTITITDQNVSPIINTSGRDLVSASLARGRPASTYMIVNAGPGLEKN